MAKEVYMPALGMNQETGTLLHWFKNEGETVRQGEPLMEVATDKTDVEIEAPASGILRNVTAQEGDDVPVGQVIAYIAAEGEELPAVAPAGRGPVAEVSDGAAGGRGTPSDGQTKGAAAPATGVAGPIAVSPVAARIAAEHGVDLQLIEPAGNRIQKEDVLAYLAAEGSTTIRSERLTPASPKARRLAQEHGMDVSALRGTGPEGAVLAEDVMQAYAAQPVAAEKPAKGEAVLPETETIPVARMWRIMAERLTESWTTVPHFYLERDVDASRLIEWRNDIRSRQQNAREEGVNITYTDMLVQLVARVLARHPRVNASWLQDGIVINRNVNVGLAVAVDDGLLVPVIHNAEKLGLRDIAVSRAELVARAQDGKLSPDSLQGGTFTVSNLGMFGIDRFGAIVNPPQAAILAVGRISDRVVPVDGRPEVRPMLSFTLSCDHRVVDGARAAAFLSDLAACVEEPLRMLD